MFKRTVDSRPPAGFPQVIDAPDATTSVTNVRGVLKDVGVNAVTARADRIRHATDEDMIWQESPSLTLLVAPALMYALLFIVLLVAAQLLQQRMTNLAAQNAAVLASVPSAASGKASRGASRKVVQPKSAIDPAQATEIVSGLTYVPYGFGAVCLLLLLHRLLVLKTTKYSATSQRLVVESGILRTVNVPFELHHLGDAVLVKPLLLRPFGVGNLAILKQGIELIGLRNATYVRDILRTGGQLEAQRIDKIRWR